MAWLPSSLREPAAPDARVVARRLAALPDRRMRSLRLGEIVGASSPSAAAWLLDTLATVGRAGGPDFDVSLLAAVDLAGDAQFDTKLRRAILDAAGERQLHACRELLTEEIEPEPQAATRGRPEPGVRPLTLGERKSLARSWRRDVLERLITDPDAAVVALLLINPRLTETDVLRIATSRRSSSQVLVLVLKSRRWGLSPRIRRALVRNPNLPSAVALRLIGLLNRTELVELASDPSVSEELRGALQRRLRPPS